MCVRRRVSAHSAHSAPTAKCLWNVHSHAARRFISHNVLYFAVSIRLSSLFFLCFCPFHRMRLRIRKATITTKREQNSTHKTKHETNYESKEMEEKKMTQAHYSHTHIHSHTQARSTPFDHMSIVGARVLCASAKKVNAPYAAEKKVRSSLDGSVASLRTERENIQNNRSMRSSRRANGGRRANAKEERVRNSTPKLKQEDKIRILPTHRLHEQRPGIGVSETFAPFAWHALQHMHRV